MPRPLSARQIQCLVMEARAAWTRQQGAGSDESRERRAGSKEAGAGSFDDWRHDECEKAVGKRGLTCADNDDYETLMAHFKSLRGEDGAAMNWHVRAQTNSARVAEHVLFREIQKASAFGCGPTYFEKICRDKYKCTILEANEHQLKSLRNDVRRTITARRRKQKTETCYEHA